MQHSNTQQQQRRFPVFVGNAQFPDPAWLAARLPREILERYRAGELNAEQALRQIDDSLAGSINSYRILEG